MTIKNECLKTLIKNNTVKRCDRKAITLTFDIELYHEVRIAAATANVTISDFMEACVRNTLVQIKKKD